MQVNVDKERGTAFAIGIPKTCWNAFSAMTMKMMSTIYSSILINLLQCTSYSNQFVPIQKRVFVTLNQKIYLRFPCL